MQKGKCTLGYRFPKLATQTSASTVVFSTIVAFELLSVWSAGNTLSSQEPRGDPATLALGSSIQKSFFFSEIPPRK